jgi:integrative and conjugative element protein (TIGR02256 family)
MNELRYLLPNDKGVVEFASPVIGKFGKHTQKRSWHREAGGQLFATFATGVFEIVEATGPRKSDKRSLFGFVPDRKMEQAEIKTRYARGLHFVGDWHTHQQVHPEPSSTDVSSMRDMVEQSDHELPGFLLVIVGTAEPPDGLHVSLHTADRYFLLNAHGEAPADVAHRRRFRRS